jgi:alcohol dehydrogenase YqhD (iron-dependent ADH family)
MENFTYQCETRIIFGRGTESRVGKEIKEKKILLHYGSGSIKKSELYERVVASLQDAGIEYVELSGVVPNPRLSMVREGIKFCIKENIGFILAVGGGSAIDSAKAIAAGVPYEGEVWDLFSKGIRPGKALPVGVVLTIPAAGSEASTASVITNEEENRKLSIQSGVLRPRFAIMNPELTFTLPKFQSACGVTDMMVHIFERYFTNTPSVDLTDRLCEATLRSIIWNARIVMNIPEDYDARANIMWASTLAHNGILGTGREEDWASHKIEHEVSAFYDVTHGAGLAVIVPAWMRYVYKQDVKRFAQFAKEVWGAEGSTDEESALEGIERTKAFFKEIGLPTTLKELGVSPEKFAEMAKAATFRGEIGNFVKLGPGDVEKIYQIALE